MTTEAEQNPSLVERKLVTILSADVAEYSRLMSEDEEQTLRIFREHSQTFRALVDMHHGRIFNTAGDALLAEFTSPIEAVRCATDIQAALRTRNEKFPRNRQVRFRIGVNLGDVMMQGTDLLGDGVNVAARLQGAAEPGGICISGSVYDQIRNKLSLSIESKGERRYKNIPLPVRTFTIAGTEDEGVPMPPPEGSSVSLVQMFQSLASALSRVSIPGLSVRSAGIAGAVLLVLAGGYWAYTAVHRSAPHKSRVSATIASAGTKPAAASVGSLTVTTFDIAANALLQAAQSLHRPQDEIDSLTSSNSQIAALAKQLHGFGKKPGDSAKVASLLAQMKSLALDMAHNEATSLQHAGAQLGEEIEKTPGKSMAADASAAIAKAQQAKTGFDDAIAAAQQAPDGNVALKAAAQALTAYEALAQACEAATPFYISARRGEFAEMAAAARSMSDRVVTLGGVSKPWLFATQARKNAYQTLSANATEAQSEAAQLDELGRRVDSATSLRKIAADLSRAAVIKAKLNRLLANSNAAYAVYNQ